MTIDIPEIAKIGWVKSWAAKNSILLISYSSYICINLLDKGIKHIFYVHKDGITTCYFGKSELTNFGEFLAEKAVENNNILVKWAEDLKKETDNAGNLFKEPIESFLELKKYQTFKKQFETYQASHHFVKMVPDYLPPDLVEKYHTILEDARVYSESVFAEMDEFLIKLAKTVAEKENYETKHILALLDDEFVEYLKTGNLPSKEILEKRSKLSGLLVQGDKSYLLGEEVLELEEQIVKHSGAATGKITGTTAFSGKIKGICRIIHDPFKVKEFNKGDILVTGMTQPDFVPLMEKAAAFVTDAGGVLCHAAIVSREMQKPCIVGTQVATKTFKDGDLIEVDAEKGIVRKLKKI